MKRDLVLVGNGMAGARFLEELLARGGADRYRITVFGEEPQGNYNRVLLSGVLAGVHAAQDIMLNAPSWYRANGIELRAGVRAVAVDCAAQRVRGADGSTARYDELVLATGSTPFVPPIEGVRAPDGGLLEGVFVFRTLADCAAILAAARSARRVAVIGGGLLGLEAARGLLRLCPEVHVVQLLPQLMEQQLDRAGARVLEATLTRLGLRVHLGVSTSAVVGEARVEGLRFADGNMLACDLLVLASGVRPNVQLAREAGLPVERGIVAGDDLAVPGHAGVHALGECAQHRGVIYGLVAPVWEQAAVLADRLSGARPEAVYLGSRVATRLKVVDVELSAMGAREASGPGDEEVLFTDAARGIYKKLVVRGGRLAGALLLGDTSAAAGLLQAFDRALPLPEDRAALLFPELAGQGAPAGVLDLPDEARICDCNGVSKGAIAAAARRAGCQSLEAVCAATRAGTGCGTCRPRVEELLRGLAQAGGGARRDAA
jgi:nitrite reductase (NADH) large subunit